MNGLLCGGFVFCFFNHLRLFFIVLRADEKKLLCLCQHPLYACLLSGSHATQTRPISVKIKDFRRKEKHLKIGLTGCVMENVYP